MKTTKINGVDCSHYFTRNTGGLAYLDVVGSNSGTMLDGTDTVDLVRRKAQLTRICKPMTDDEIKDFFAILRQKKYPVVEFYDAEIGYRESEMIYTTSEMAQLDALMGDDYWTQLAVTFTER